MQPKFPCSVLRAVYVTVLNGASESVCAGALQFDLKPRRHAIPSLSNTWGQQRPEILDVVCNPCDLWDDLWISPLWFVEKHEHQNSSAT